MARQIDEFILAWNALSSSSSVDGWRSICVAPAGDCILKAGRHFPGNQEALLAGFVSATIPVAEQLPEGHGFEVARVDIYGDSRRWIALTRKESGSFELFCEMVGDVTGAMDVVSAGGEARILRAMLGRVKLWQEFMRKGVQALTNETELGLVGEILVLNALIDAGVPSCQAIEAWIGPEGGVQDFVLGSGAIEVKTTLSSLGFPAKIGSIEQLDDSVRKPIFVSGVRVSLRETGKNLPNLISLVTENLQNDPEAMRMFTDKLLKAGYIHSHAEHYFRRFCVDEIKTLEVSDGFPRIISGNVPDGIRRAAYEIDLDRISKPNLDISIALKKLGVS